MSEAVSALNIGTKPDPLRIAERIRSERRQHWSSPFAARRVHLIGVGGSGMSGLAGVLLRCGAIVSGSDLVETKTFQRLEELGATIRIGQAPINIPTDGDFVVYSAAIKEDNVELKEARRQGLCCLKYAEMLGQVMRQRTGIAIAGTHGKSTTTALLAYILRRAKVDPTFVVGAEAKQLAGSSGVGEGPHFVVEACEYDRSFLNLSPKYAAILNVEEDHLDCFDGLDAIIDAFRAFSSLVPSDGIVVANGEDPAARRAVRDISAPVETFGFGEDAFWHAENIEHDHGCYAFDVIRNGGFFLRASMDHLPGRHQVGNALVAAAMAHHAGIAAESIAESLSSFAGAHRRLTERGEVGGLLLLDDYGHHPTEIRVTLRAVCEHYPGRRLWVVFQPHQHSRTRFLLDDFARSFGRADHLLVPDIYFVRDSEAERGTICSGNLVDRVRANGGDAIYLPSHEEIVEHVMAHAKAGDVVMTMGAGDVWKIADELVRRLA
ncbi:MAG: UDP-N-acetylmuramate--L-alanine ligase [Phycisphaerae bacterium]|nr:UDP-N-acetylmuramate--L-alanine ligase [Phycisphaerae bacterium]